MFCSSRSMSGNGSLLLHISIVSVSSVFFSYPTKISDTNDVYLDHDARQLTTHCESFPYTNVNLSIGYINLGNSFILGSIDCTVKFTDFLCFRAGHPHPTIGNTRISRGCCYWQPVSQCDVYIPSICRCLFDESSTATIWRCQAD